MVVPDIKCNRPVEENAMNTTTQLTQPDTRDMETFEERLVGALNEAGMLMMLSMGHRLALFEAMQDGRALTSRDLADRTGLNERYVREWLGALTAAGVLTMSPSDHRYRLPPAHAALLTNDGEANMAVFTQYLPMMGQVEEDILHCFRHGGGVPYDRFPRFHAIMAEDSGQTVLAALFDHILPLAPELPERLDKGIRVLDVGCGRGKALILMAERYRNSEFSGYDLSEEAVAWARSQSKDKGLDNLTFEARDLSDFDQTATPGAFDLVTTFDAIHDQARPLNVLTGIRRTLKDDGIYLAQDIHAHTDHHKNTDHPVGAFLYALSIHHCMTVSLAQDGEGLGTMWGREQAVRYMETAGFRDIRVERLDHDIQNDYFICRP